MFAEGDDLIVYHLRSTDCHLPKQHQAAICSLSARAGANAPSYRLRGADDIDMMIGLAASGATIYVEGSDRRVSVRNLEAISNVHAPASSITFVN